MKMKNRKQRLDARVKDYEQMKAAGSDKNGKTIYVYQTNGKLVTFHKPGSMNK